MQSMNETQMDAVVGGEIDPDCLSWAAGGMIIGSLGGFAGALGGAIIGYSACSTYKALTE